MDQRRIDALLEARGERSDAARPDAVAAVRASGRMTARERMQALLDPGSAVEYGSIAARTPEGQWVPESGGVDFVGTVDGQVVIASSTDYTDHGGGYGAGKLTRLYALAHAQHWPLLLFVDGGGSRARHARSGMGHIELSGPVGRFGLFDGMAELSGWTPTVAIVSGPSFAGHASLAAFSDFVIATRRSSIGMGGPPMVEAALGLRLTPSELAGVDMHDELGGIDLLVDDEPTAIAMARRYLGFYRDQPAGQPSASADRIRSIVPDEGSYDAREVIEALVDADSAFELRPSFAKSVITALARMDGRSVGVLANQPTVDDGAIDENAATKIARFVELCDAYEYPILSLIDTPGFVTRWSSAVDEGDVAVEPGMTRYHARTLMAHHHRTVPVFSVQIRRGYGLGPFAMAGYGDSHGVSAMRLAWPTVEVGLVDGFFASQSQNPFDDVVDPAETRERIIRTLRHIKRTLDQPEKKHPIDTW